MEMLKMTMKDIEDYLKFSKTVIIPAGSIEEHSQALPLGTDTLTAEALAIEVGKRTTRVVAPVISSGNCNSVTFDFPGTLSISPTNLINFLVDYITSLYRHGFQRFLFVNGHGGNIAPIRCAIDAVSPTFRSSRFSVGSWWLFEELKELYDNAGHAGRGEVSIMLYLYPELVKKELFSEEHRTIPHYYVSNDLSKTEITKSGIINDSQNGTRDLGKRIFEEACQAYIRLLQELES